MFRSRNSAALAAIFLCVLLCQNRVECKRGKGGSRHTGGKHTTPRSQRVTEHHQSNYYHQANAPPPYQSNQHQPNTPPYHTSNNNPIGFEGFQNRPQHNAPPYPVNNNPIGFENVHQKVGGSGQQANAPPPPGFNYPHSNSNYQPPSNYHPQGTGYNNPNNPNRYNPNQNHYNTNQNHYNPNQGQYYNPSLSQPNSYYTPVNTNNFPGAVHPQMYQPTYVQQPSKGGIGALGGAALGAAGGLAGGYLIGKLTSDKSGGDGDRSGYTVHHYHNNRQDVPQKLSVSDNSLATCSNNSTQGLCVPNTFPICLSNGTIMCVTHLPYTTPCNGNMSCVVTVLPCPKNDTTCNSTENVPTTAVYIPCISNVTIVNGNKPNAMVVNPGNRGTQLCVTAIAEPKLAYTRVGSIVMLMKDILATPIEIAKNQNDSQNRPQSTWIEPNYPPPFTFSVNPDIVTTTPVSAVAGSSSSALRAEGGNGTTASNLPLPTYSPENHAAANITEMSRWI